MKSQGISKVIQMRFLFISNLYLHRQAANCLQSRAMACAFSTYGPVTCHFKDNSSLLFRLFRTIFAAFTREIVFTRSFVIAWVAGLVRVRCLYELHEIHPHRKYHWLCLSNRTLVICISKMLKLRLEQTIQGRSLPIISVRDGCNTQLINELKEQRDGRSPSRLRTLAPNKKILLHTGSAYKFDVTRFDEIIAMLPPDWVFVQMGAVTSGAISRFSTNDRMIFLGQSSHEEALAAQLEADCLLYLNFPESRMYEYTSPLKLFEYIATGKPLISTRGGATDEVVCELSEVGEYGDMHSYLSELESRDLTLLLAEQSAELMKEISWDTRVRKIIDGYKAFESRT